MNPYYNRKFNYDFTNDNNGDRFFIGAPFLFGALAGGAVVSLTRPRPIVAYPPYPVYQPPYAYGYSQYYNYRPY